MWGESGFIETRVGRVHYRHTGEDNPLVLLHATPRSSRSFKNLAGVMAEKHRVIAPDTLGFGESDPLPEDVTIPMLADSLHDVLVALGMDSVSLFGLHTGNKIAAAFARAYPERVNHLVLCGMTHSIILDRAAREAAIKELVSKPFTRADVSDDEKQDRRQGAESVDRMYAANYGFDLSEALPRISVPTMVLELATPEEDRFGRQAASVVRQLQHGVAQTFEGSDRDALDKRPEEFAQLILSFTAHGEGSPR